MFSGRYEYTIDDKGRLSIPAKFRDTISSHHGSALMVTNHMDGCLVAYTLKEWEALENKIEDADPVLKEEVSNILRFFYSGAQECPIDRLGRILVPQSLRVFGGIKKDVVIAGLNKKIEIWAAENWAEVMKQMASDMATKGGTAKRLGL
jgi:MraZ protein